MTLNSAKERKVNTIIILTSRHTFFVAHSLQKIFLDNGFGSSIITDFDDSHNDERALFVVICPQIFKKLPSKYISFQMEQSINPRWFTKEYFEILRKSIIIFDYSIKNIEYLQNNDFSYKQLFFTPLSIFENYNKFLIERGYWDGKISEEKCDVIFYGDPSNERRKLFLDKLREKFSVKVISDKFGNDLYSELLSAKIVVNVHYYEDALLETTRIYECLSLGIPVISEESGDMDSHTRLGDLILFSKIGDIDDMIVKIDNFLSSENKHNGIGKSELRNMEYGNFNFYINRALLSLDLVDFDAVNPLLNNKIVPNIPSKQNIFCLGLPENIERRKSFIAEKYPDFFIFDGLRHSCGWVGCGLSYKYLLSMAKALGLEYVVICEDDVKFPDNFREKISEIMQYLKTTEQKWDMFSGFIADINENANILNIDKNNENEYIYIDKTVSMVFNVYHKSVYDRIISWDNKIMDVDTNTIDRFIEMQDGIVTITTLPFLVGHKEDQFSSIWENQHNTQYEKMIRKTDIILGDKIIIYNAVKNKQVDLISGLIRKKYHEINALVQTIQQKEYAIEQRDRLIHQKDQIIKQKEQEIIFMKSSKYWILRDVHFKFKFILFSPGKFLKKYFKKSSYLASSFFHSIRNEGMGTTVVRFCNFIVYGKGTLNPRAVAEKETYDDLSKTLKNFKK